MGGDGDEPTARAERGIWRQLCRMRADRWALCACHACRDDDGAAVMPTGHEAALDAVTCEFRKLERVNHDEDLRWGGECRERTC